MYKIHDKMYNIKVYFVLYYRSIYIYMYIITFQ